MEPCLNGTLVQADRTNKEVGVATGQGPRGSGHTLVSVIVTVHKSSI